MLFWFEVACKPLQTRRTSMSDWMLYHVWGIRGYRVASCEKVVVDAVWVTIEPLPSVVRCPHCGSKDVIRKGVKMRLFLSAPIGRRRVYFDAAIPRVHCLGCDLTRQVRIPFA